MKLNPFSARRCRQNPIVKLLESQNDLGEVGADPASLERLETNLADLNWLQRQPWLEDRPDQTITDLSRAHHSRSRARRALLEKCENVSQFMGPVGAIVFLAGAAAGPTTTIVGLGILVARYAVSELYHSNNDWQMDNFNPIEDRLRGLGQRYEPKSLPSPESERLSEIHQNAQHFSQAVCRELKQESKPAPSSPLTLNMAKNISRRSLQQAAAEHSTGLTQLEKQAFKANGDNLQEMLLNCQGQGNSLQLRQQLYDLGLEVIREGHHDDFIQETLENDLVRLSLSPKLDSHSIQGPQSLAGDFEVGIVKVEDSVTGPRPSSERGPDYQL